MGMAFDDRNFSLREVRVVCVWVLCMALYGRSK